MAANRERTSCHGWCERFALGNVRGPVFLEPAVYPVHMQRSESRRARYFSARIQRASVCFLHIHPELRHDLKGEIEFAAVELLWGNYLSFHEKRFLLASFPALIASIGSIPNFGTELFFWDNILFLRARYDFDPAVLAVAVRVMQEQLQSTDPCLIASANFGIGGLNF